ncbi:MAG: tetratricopeptide repeat protein [Bdellovibrionales bacterium]|nr:tetratricopeptide repeat protein [Bdellovibrionales bacterium]
MRILAFLMVICTLSCASSDKNKRFSLIHTEIGTSYLKDKKYALAFRELFTAVEIDPKNEVAHNNLALTYLSSQKPEQAKEHFLEAIKLNPKYTDAITNLGALYLSEQQYNLAKEQFEIAKKDLTYTEPEKLNANLGATYFHLGDFVKAEEFLKQSILSDRKYCPAHRYYGATLYHLNLLDRAQKAIEHAIGLCKTEKYPELFYYGGLTYYKLGDTTKANAKWKELEGFYPNHSYVKEINTYQNIIEKAL